MKRFSAPKTALASAVILAAALGTAATGGALQKTGDSKAPAEKQPAAKAQSKPLPEPKVKVGSMAPDLALLDQNRKEWKLSDLRGKKNVILAFYVFAFTGG